MNNQDLKTKGSALLDDVNTAVRENPVAAGLIGLGAAWLLFGGARSMMPGSLMPSMDTVASAGRRSAQAVTDNVKSVGASAMKVAHDAGDAATTGVRSVADQAKDGYAEIASQTSQRAGELKDYASDASRQFMNTSSDLFGQTQANLRDAFERQPLLIGVLGATVGIGIASAFPRTRLETEWLGDASASARKTAETLATEAGNVAKRVSDAVSSEAQAQGLTTDGLKDATRSTREKLSAVGAAALTLDILNAKDRKQT
jgi:hypothetical protein